MSKTEKRKSTGGSAPGKSALLTWMNGGLDKLAALLGNSSIVNFFCGFDKLEEDTASSLLVGGYQTVVRNVRRKFSRKPRREVGTEQLSPREVGIFATGSLPRSIKNRIGEAVEGSLVLNKVGDWLKRLLYVPMMYYGVFLFSFGLFTTVMQALLYFLLQRSNGAALDLFVGLALVLLSLPVMFKGYEPVLDVFRESVVGNFVLRALQVRSLNDAGRKKRQPAFLFFLVGMVCGLLTFAAQPLLFLLLIVVLMAAICISYVPESGICMLLFLLPFLSQVPHASFLMAGAIFYIGICFLLKVMIGRRSFTFNIMDGSAIFFGLTVLLTGLAGGKSSSDSALLYAAMISGYFVVSNLLRSQAWIRRSVLSLNASAFFVSAVGIIGCLLDHPDSIALLPDSLIATHYLVAVIPVTLAALLCGEHKRGRFGCLLVLAAEISYLVLLRSTIGLVALSVELLFFFLLYTRKTWTALLLILLALPVASYFIHPDFSMIFEKIAASDRGSLWQALWKVASGAPLSGIGMSDSVLLSAIAENSAADLSLSNTFLRLLVQVGIPGLIGFGLFILLRYVAGFTMLHKYGSRERSTALYLSFLASLTGLLLVGTFSYLWSDNCLLLLFWMSAGIARALQRAARRSEEEKDPPYFVRRDGVQCVDVELSFSVSGNSQAKDLPDEA